MPISVSCSSCGAGFKAKDELAGRRVGCPKCKKPIGIPYPKVQAANDPLMSLLDEANISEQAKGPTCANCGDAIDAMAIICVACGYNQQTGEMLETEAASDSQKDTRRMTDAERLMMKAEQEIDDSPMEVGEQEFGEGAESYMIAMIAMIAGIVMVAVGIGVVFSMDTINQYVATSAVSFIASILMYLAMGAWITIVAFMASPNQGIACLASLLTYCVIFGFMQGKALLLPTVIMLIAFLVSIAAGAYTIAYGWTPESQGAAAQLVIDVVQSKVL